MCKKCDSLWGTPTENCFVKSHSLIDFNEDEVLYNTMNDDEKQCNDDNGNENDNLLLKNVPSDDDSILQKDDNIPPVIFIHVF